MEKYWAMGDIHGEFGKMMDAFDFAKTFGFDLDDPTQHFVQLGDKCDRGPKTYEVVEYLKCLYESYPEQVHMIQGNHEIMMLECASHYGFGTANWFEKNNGGTQTLKSYASQTGIYGKHGLGNALQKANHWDFLVKKNELFHETPDYFFCHAPIPKYMWRRIDEDRDFRRDRDTLTWSYNGAIPEDDWVDKFLIPIEEDGNFYGKHKYTVYGHLHGMKYFRRNKLSKDGTWQGAYTEELYIPGARKYGNAVFLDSGCGCAPEAPLSMLELPELNVYTSDCQTFNLIGGSYNAVQQKEV